MPSFDIDNLADRHLPDKHDELSDHLEYVGQGQVGYVGVRGGSLSDTPADSWKHAEGGLNKKYKT